MQLRPEALSRAYGVAMEAVENPLTNHMDIFTSLPARDERHREWLQILLGRTAEGGEAS